MSAVFGTLISSASSVVVSRANVHAPRFVARSEATMKTVAPYDPRSVTESFEMWNAMAPPEGFTWGYDSRSTTETYEMWLASEAGKEAGADAPAAPATTEGVPSVGDSLYSWYDMGIRLTVEDKSESDEPTEGGIIKGSMPQQKTHS